MSILVRGTLAAVTALIVSIGLLGAAPPAPAAATPDGSVAELEPYALSDCPTGTACLWSGSAYSGSLWKNTSTDVIVNRPATVLATASMWNRTTYYVRLYSGVGGTGSTACYSQGWQGVLTGWAANARSLRMSTGC